MASVRPYLLFDGTCAEAMRFYAECLGGVLTVTTVAQTPMSTQLDPGQQQKVVNARLVGGPADISASDWLHPRRRPLAGNTVCLYLTADTGAELTGYFTRLAAGADSATLDPLSEQPFGVYGALTDRFGVRWMFRADGSDPPGTD